MPIAPPPTRDATVEAQVFWLRYQKEIAAALVIAILAMIGFAGYRFYLNRRDSNAAGLLGNARTQEDYQTVIAKYSGTPAGASAYLLLADKERNEKKFAEANGTLKEFVDKYPDHELAATAQLAMAANLEAMGKNDEALAIYQQVATKYSNSFSAPLAMISQVPLLKAKNRNDDARRICEDILTKYRMPGQPADASGADNRVETVWAAEAMRQLRLLKPAEQPKPPATAGNAPPPMIAAPSGAPAPPGAPPTPKKP